MTGRAGRAAGLVALLVLASLVGPTAHAGPTPQTVSGWSFVYANATLNASAPDVAVAPDGHVTAVWSRWETVTTPGNTTLWSSDFDDATGWGAPVRFDGGTGYAPTAARLAVDGAGSLTAIWTSAVSGGAGVWSAQRAPGGNWSAPVLVGLGSSPSVAADPGGNVTVGWRLFAGLNQDAWSARFTPGGGWGAPALIETNDSGSVDAPFVSASAGGSAFAVWSQFISGRSVVWANRYTPGGGWENQTLLSVNTTTSSSLPQVAADASGGAHAVWLQSDGTRNNVWTSRFAPGSGWGPPALLESLDVSHASTPQVASAPDGRAVAAWLYYNGSQTSALSARFDPASGWSAPAYIEHDDAGPVLTPSVRIDPDGRAFAAWLQSNGTVTDVWVARDHPLAGWSPAERAETVPQTGAGQLRAALGSQGRAAVVWAHPSGGRTAIVAYVDDVGPLLTVSSPGDGVTVDVPTVRLVGRTDPGATLHAAGLVVAVAPDGSFAFNLALLPGPNTILMTAWDADGMQSDLRLTVTFADPVPSINASLTLAHTRIQGALNQLSALTARVGAVEVDAAGLSDANADRVAQVEALEAELANLSVDLADVRADLTAARENLSALAQEAQALDGRQGSSETEVARLWIAINESAEQVEAASQYVDTVSARIDEQQSALAVMRGDVDRARAMANDTAVDQVASSAVQDEDRRRAEETAARVEQLTSSVALLAIALLVVGALAAVQALLAARRHRGPVDWPKGPRQPPSP